MNWSSAIVVRRCCEFVSDLRDFSPAHGIETGSAGKQKRLAAVAALGVCDMPEDANPSQPPMDFPVHDRVIG